MRQAVIADMVVADKKTIEDLEVKNNGIEIEKAKNEVSTTIK